MYHFLTNNHLTLLMPSKEKLSQLSLKGVYSTHYYIFCIHLIPFTIKSDQKKLENSVSTTSKINSCDSLCQCLSNSNVHTNYLVILFKHRFWYVRSGVEPEIMEDNRLPGEPGASDSWPHLDQTKASLGRPKWFLWHMWIPNTWLWKHTHTHTHTHTNPLLKKA